MESAIIFLLHALSLYVNDDESLCYLLFFKETMLKLGLARSVFSCHLSQQLPNGSQLT